MKAHSLASAIAILQRHHMLKPDTSLPEVSDHELTHADADFLLNVLTEQQPMRIVFYDAEMLYDDDAYAELLNRFASATQDEWVLRDAASVIQTAADDPHIAEYSITFHLQQQLVAWHVPYVSKWVSDAFIDLILAFAEKHLPGTFLHLPTWDQCAIWVYLPHAVAQELQWMPDVIARLEQEHLHRWLTRAFGRRHPSPDGP